MDKISCEICGRKELVTYINGKTKDETYAKMCNNCHAEHGTGMGDNLGQLYVWDYIMDKYSKKDSIWYAIGDIDMDIMMIGD